MASRSFVVCCVLALLVSGGSADPTVGLLGDAVGTVGGVVGGVVGGAAGIVGGVAATILELPRILLLTGVDFFLGIFQVFPVLRTPLYEVIYPQGPLTIEFVNGRLNQCSTILQQLVAQKQITYVQAQDIQAKINAQLRAVLAGKLDTNLLIPVKI